MATILLVDDSKALLNHIRRMLTKGGHEVVPASSGRQAICYLAATSIDLVLTDLYMPPPDGFELVDAVRALPKPPPIVVMSSNVQACDIFRNAQTLGPAATLAKPFSSEQLREVIDRVLAGTLAASSAEAAPVMRAASAA